MTSITGARPPRIAAIAIAVAGGAMAISAMVFYRQLTQNHFTIPASTIRVHMRPARSTVSTPRNESATTATKSASCTTKTNSCSVSPTIPTTGSTVGEPTCHLVPDRCSSHHHSAGVSARHPFWVAGRYPIHGSQQTSRFYSAKCKRYAGCQ